MKRRLIGMILTLAMTLPMLLSGAAVAEGAEPQYGGTLIIAYTSEPDTMNTYSTHLLADVQHCMIEGLIVPNENLEYVPVLVKEVPTLENGLIQLTDDGKMTITYNLKENVRWHDGEPLTSADVKFTWEAVKDEAFIAEGKEGTEDIDSIDCPDDYTVVCNYNKVVADFATTLFTFGILPKHVIEGTDLNAQTGYNVAPIGTGPYKFVEWVAGEYIELARNEDYHDEGAYMDGIVFKFLPDPNTQLVQLKTGEVQFAMGMPTDMYEDLAAIDGMVTETPMLNAWFHVDFNFQNPLLAEKEVRQAINYCVDKYGICENLLQGLYLAWDSPWQPMDQYHNPNLPEHVYDVEEAKAVLEAAGWVVGADGIRERDGEKLEFGIQGRTGYTDDLKIQQIIIDACKEAGISLIADNGAAASQSARWSDGDYDLKMHRWITGSASRTRFFSKDHIPFNNNSWWVNDEITALLAESDTMLDVEERKESLFRAQEILIEELPTIVIYNYVQLVTHTDKLQGFVPNPTNMTHFWHVKDWWLEQ
ncbi:peptide ABC transporter substrate-binding protein [Eubacteriales bacterium OttesenSCG-928-A19]|nr:peptide ABC transporter substrate-binding protein [Eubacteriales bacterium OttesenSCG-928-A19]